MMARHKIPDLIRMWVAKDTPKLFEEYKKRVHELKRLLLRVTADKRRIIFMYATNNVFHTCADKPWPWIEQYISVFYSKEHWQSMHERLLALSATPEKDHKLKKFYEMAERQKKVKDMQWVRLLPEHLYWAALALDTVLVGRILRECYDGSWSKLDVEGVHFVLSGACESAFYPESQEYLQKKEAFLKMILAKTKHIDLTRALDTNECFGISLLWDRISYFSQEVDNLQEIPEVLDLLLQRFGKTKSDMLLFYLWPTSGYTRSNAMAILYVLQDTKYRHPQWFKTVAKWRREKWNVKFPRLWNVLLNDGKKPRQPDQNGL